MPFGRAGAQNPNQGRDIFVASTIQWGHISRECVGLFKGVLALSSIYDEYVIDNVVKSYTF